MLDRLYDIDSVILIEIGNSPTDAAARAKWAKLLLQEHNTTYELICAKRIHPTVCEEVTLDADKAFRTMPAGSTASSLAHGYRKLIGVTDEENHSYDPSGRAGSAYDCYQAEPGLYIVPDAEASGTVWVEYEHLPPELTDNTSSTESSIPELVPEELRIVFVYYGVAAIRRSRRMFQSMVLYEQKAEAKLAEMPVENRPKTVKNTLFRGARSRRGLSL